MRWSWVPRNRRVVDHLQDKSVQFKLSTRHRTNAEWHHVVFAWDGSQRKLCVDGVAVAEDTQDTLEGSEHGLYIGTGKLWEPESFFSGLIDDVRIYDTALTAK